MVPADEPRVGIAFAVFFCAVHRTDPFTPPKVGIIVTAFYGGATEAFWDRHRRGEPIYDIAAATVASSPETACSCRLEKGTTLPHEERRIAVARIYDLRTRSWFR